MVPGQTCSTCRHFSGIDKQCRAKSPVAIAVLDAHGQLARAWGIWPPTNPDGWCGDWVPETNQVN